MLDNLSAAQHLSLRGCTSKRVDFAESILDSFSLHHHFSFVNGDDVGIEK
jgi:phosphoglycolate phosphatase-like HAD superfamily hydrolase